MNTSAAATNPNTDALKLSYGILGVPVKGIIFATQFGSFKASPSSTSKYIAPYKNHVTGMVARGIKPKSKTTIPMTAMIPGR
jgi:hypothetical protein